MYKLFFSILILTFSLISCQNNTDCSQFSNVTYPNYQNHTLLSKEFSSYRDTLLKRLDVTSINDLNHTSYQLLFYSSHRYGKSIRFEKTKSGYFLTVKCIGSELNNVNCNDYKINIEQS